MSSAKHSKRLWRSTDWTLLTKRVKSKGERWPPWGTPEVAIKGSDLKSNSLSHWDLCVKKDSNHDRRGSPIPEDRSMWRRTLWLTESNALEKSVYITSTWAPTSKKPNIYLHKVMLNVTVDRPGQKPCCSSMSTERFTDGWISFKTRASNILDMWLSMEIGL